MKTNKYPFPTDPRLKDVKFIVTGEDGFRFWKEYHNLCECEQDSVGLNFQYADFGKEKPCWGTAFFYKVDGILTVFVESSGAYTDWFKFEKFVFGMCGMEPSPDNHCNEDNMHNHPAVQNASDARRIVWMAKESEEIIKSMESTMISEWGELVEDSSRYGKL